MVEPWRKIMQEYITKDKEFKIIPRDPSGISKCIVKDLNEDYFEVELTSDENYEAKEPVELFANTAGGVLYFQTEVKSLKDKNVEIFYPNDYKFLQRREYTRVCITKEIILLSSENKIKAQMLDISAGGMKITLKEQLNLSEDYKISLSFDKNLSLDVSFQPIRLESDDILGYTVSGRFKNIKNIDRIALVQFCFKKQLEDQNK